MLHIKNLEVEVNNKKILKGIDLDIKEKDIQVLIGPNASGKSTLAHAIIGDPRYKIKKGKIYFLGKNIKNLPIEKRIEVGISLAWQFPPPIKGIKLIQLLTKISKRYINTEIAKNILNKELNLNLSGGEKKISELIQILSLDPKLVIFDEIDSGLDIKRIEKFSKIIKDNFVKKKIPILLITHSGEILRFLKPNLVNVMVDGKIIWKNKDYKKVLSFIKKYGYEKYK